jgi:hypothetical protein
VKTIPGFDNSINYVEKSYEDIFRFLLQGMQDEGILSTAISIDDIILYPEKYASNVVVMECSVHAQMYSERYKDLTRVNNGINIDLAPAQPIVQENDALANLGRLFIGDPYPPGYAVTEVTFHVDEPSEEDVHIPSGVIIQSERNSNIFFRTTRDDTLLDGTTDISIPVVCTESGPGGNVEANTLTIMVDPIPGIEAVNNLQAAYGGSDGETQESYRERLKKWKNTMVRGNPDALEAAIKSVAGVNDYYIEPHPDDEYGVTYISIDPGTPSVLEAVRSTLEVWKAVDEKVIVSAVTTETINVNAEGNASIDLTVPYSANELARFGELASHYLKVYINGGANRDGSTYKGLGIGQDFIKSRAVSYVLSQVSELKDLVLSAPASNVSVAADKKAVAGSITITVV